MSLESIARELWPVLWRPGATVVLRGQPPEVKAFTRALLSRYPLPAVQGIRLKTWAPGAPGRVLDVVDATDLDAWLADTQTEPSGVSAQSPSWASTRPDVSVVVPTYRRFEALCQLMKRLEGQVQAPPFELIIVDDGSPEGPRAWPDLRSTPLPVRILRQANQGPAAARNRALRDARAELVLFLNDDAVPAADLVARHAAQWENGSGDAVVMGPFSLIPSCRRDSFAELVETTNLLFPQPVLPGPGPFPGVILCTGNCSLPTRWLLEVGGFDTWFTKAGGEDSELGRRMHAVEGRTVRYVQDLSCGHDHQLTVADFARRQEHLGRSSVYLARRWGDHRVVTGDARVPIQGPFIASLRRRLVQGSSILGSLPHQLDAQCAQERRDGRLASDREPFESAVRRLGLLAFSRGVLAEWGAGLQ
jgi:GT2 family glycosyltransferase